MHFEEGKEGMTDWLSDWLTDWQLRDGRKSDWLIDWSIDWLIDWLIDWVIDWLIDWLIEWLTDWLSDLLIIFHRVKKAARRRVRKMIEFLITPRSSTSQPLDDEKMSTKPGFDNKFIRATIFLLIFVHN